MLIICHTSKYMKAHSSWGKEMLIHVLLPKGELIHGFHDQRDLELPLEVIKVLQDVLLTGFSSKPGDFLGDERYALLMVEIKQIHMKKQNIQE